jgi:hypothetical protein
MWLDRRKTIATLGFLTIWLAFTGWMGLVGIVGQRVDKFPPGIALLTVPVMVVVLAVVLTRGGAALAKSIPLNVFIALQVYRVGVELFCTIFRVSVLRRD